MSNAIIPVELPDPLLHDAAMRAEKAGVSVSTWIRDMIEDRIRNEEVTARFLRRRAAGASGDDLLAILDKAPDTPPQPGDELEA
jgi:cytochrome P450